MEICGYLGDVPHLDHVWATNTIFTQEMNSQVIEKMQEYLRRRGRRGSQFLGSGAVLGRHRLKSSWSLIFCETKFTKDICLSGLYSFDINIKAVFLKNPGADKKTSTTCSTLTPVCCHLLLVHTHTQTPTWWSNINLLLQFSWMVSDLTQVWT